MENVHSLFLSPQRGRTPFEAAFEAAQKEHCPHCNHSTYLCREHGL